MRGAPKAVGALGALGVLGVFGVFGAFGVFGVFGVLGALGASGALGALGASGVLGALGASGVLGARPPPRAPGPRGGRPAALSGPTAAPPAPLLARGGRGLQEGQQPGVRDELRAPLRAELVLVKVGQGAHAAGLVEAPEVDHEAEGDVERVRRVSHESHREPLAQRPPEEALDLLPAALEREEKVRRGGARGDEEVREGGAPLLVAVPEVEADLDLVRRVLLRPRPDAEFAGPARAVVGRGHPGPRVRRPPSAGRGRWSRGGFCFAVAGGLYKRGGRYRQQRGFRGEAAKRVPRRMEMSGRGAEAAGETPAPGTSSAVATPALATSELCDFLQKSFYLEGSLSLVTREEKAAEDEKVEASKAETAEAKATAEAAKAEAEAAKAEAEAARAEAAEAATAAEAAKAEVEAARAETADARINLAANRAAALVQRIRHKNITEQVQVNTRKAEADRRGANVAKEEAEEKVEAAKTASVAASARAEAADNLTATLQKENIRLTQQGVQMKAERVREQNEVRSARLKEGLQLKACEKSVAQLEEKLAAAKITQLSNNFLQQQDKETRMGEYIARINNNVKNMSAGIDKFMTIQNKSRDDFNQIQSTLKNYGVVLQSLYEEVEKDADVKDDDKTNCNEALDKFNLLLKTSRKQVQQLKKGVRFFARFNDTAGERIITTAINELALADNTYDLLYPYETSQESVFEEVDFMVENLYQGANSVIIAYGQSGSGKTFTMLGAKEEQWNLSLNDGELQKTFGIIPRCAFKIFKEGYTLELTITEYIPEVPVPFLKCVYDQKILINTTACKTYEHFSTLCQQAFDVRESGETSENPVSSRSHLAVEIKPIPKEGSGVGSITLIDLAGSENSDGQVEEMVKAVLYVQHESTPKDRLRKAAGYVRTSESGKGSASKQCKDNDVTDDQLAKLEKFREFYPRSRGINCSLQVIRNLLTKPKEYVDDFERAFENPSLSPSHVADSKSYSHVGDLGLLQKIMLARNTSATKIIGFLGLNANKPEAYKQTLQEFVPPLGEKMKAKMKKEDDAANSLPEVKWRDIVQALSNIKNSENDAVENRFLVPFKNYLNWYASDKMKNEILEDIETLFLTDVFKAINKDPSLQKLHTDWENNTKERQKLIASWNQAKADVTDDTAGDTADV